MATSYLEPEELVKGNLWLKTVFFPAVADNDSVNEYINDKTLDGRYYVTSSVISYCKRSCKHLYNAICNHYWDVNGTLEDEIQFLTKKYNSYLPNPDDYANAYTFTTKQVCRILANMCAKAQIFWDDTQHTAEELAFFKETPFGKALWDFNCFVSQEPDDNKIKVSSSSETRTPRSSSSSGTTSSGSKLNINNCGGLLDKTKEILNQSEVYWICGEFTRPGKTKPRIHVSPAGQASPLKVKFGSGQGYDDCILYFKDPAAAGAFKDICDQNKPSDVNNLAIKRVRVDTNGYFKVQTIWGEAYIAAKKLHESFVEEDEEELVDQVLEAKEPTNLFIDIGQAFDRLAEFLK